MDAGDMVEHPWTGTLRELLELIPSGIQPDLTGSYWYSAWFGDWGVNGDGLFCTKRCGFAFGTAIAQQQRKGER